MASRSPVWRLAGAATSTNSSLQPSASSYRWRYPSRRLRAVSSIVALITVLLTLGTRESATVNAVMVVIKLAILIFFIVVAFTAFNSGNFVPFAPQGAGGVAAAAGVIFFAYIGFDAVSTGSEESKNPGRDLPIAVIGSLLISTVL
jgi:APA family basic amino acid/polyamine antiporter